ncbi:MAG: anaerobic sulfatase-maturation protein [Bacteroidales bacterium]|nr:anaerobic sulfatase-maturation protein [Bacteroidales bacterium]
MLSFNQPVAFHIMAKPYGPVCNLNCTYCYYLEKKKLYPQQGNFRMDDSILEEYIKQFIESQDVPVVSFTWQGGEPTMLDLGFFKNVIALQKKYRGAKTIENAFQTNGTLIDADWCKFLHDNNFLVGISVDGPQHIHDKYRVYKSGGLSFGKVIEAVNLLKQYRVEFNTLTVVHNESTQYPLEIYDFLKSTGSGYIQFIPIVERIKEDSRELKLVGPEYENARITPWSVNPEAYGKFLITIFDEWVRKDVSRIFVQLFDVTLANWTGQPSGLCVFDETCGNAMVLEHNGDLYSCDHYVYPKHLLGNIQTTSLKNMALSTKQYVFGQDKLLGLPAYCMDCEYRFACHGECPKHRFEKTPDGERGLNYLCKAYKMFFSYVHPYMQFMGDELAARRPPANVMQWAQRLKSYHSK